MRIGPITRKLLEMASDGAVAFILAKHPYGDKLLERYKIDVTRTRRSRLRKTLYKLDDLGLLSLSGEKVEITEKGQRLLKRIENQEIIIEKSKWKGYWYLVSYDIPEYLKKERDWFRSKLKKLGFLQIQDSLWVIPYDCKEEIAVIAHSLSVSPYVVYMMTDHLPMEKRLIIKFGLEEQY